MALTWWRGPFATATPGSVHMDPAARRLKTALLAAFDTAAAAGTATSAGQRTKYMHYTHVYLLHAVYCQTLLASQLDFVT
jgi:hypothetical protein